MSVTTERRALQDEIMRTREELEAAESAYNNASSPAYADAAWYRIQAARALLQGLMQDAKRGCGGC